MWGDCSSNMRRVETHPSSKRARSSSQSWESVGLCKVARSSTAAGGRRSSFCAAAGGGLPLASASNAVSRLPVPRRCSTKKIDFVLVFVLGAEGGERKGVRKGIGGATSSSPVQAHLVLAGGALHVAGQEDALRVVQTARVST